jgi:hypothetical protein
VEIGKEIICRAEKPLNNTKITIRRDRAISSKVIEQRELMKGKNEALKNCIKI